MNINLPSDRSIRSGTIGGTTLAFISQLTSTEVLKTVVLAAIGATVSFGVSLFLKWMSRKLKNH